jgi:hypothetical protein
VKSREVVAGPFGVGQVWQTHLALTRTMQRNDELPFEPSDCGGSLVIYANDGQRPVLTECDVCGCEVSFAQATAPGEKDDGERLTVPDADDIPL